jgi:hypothetical protein
MLKNVRTHCVQVHHQLDRAETLAAAAFAAAEIRSADHVTAELATLATELTVLEAAGGMNLGRTLSVPVAHIAALPEPTRTEFVKLARLPFTVIPVRAAEGRNRTFALRALRSIARDADRDVLWCSPTQDQADQISKDLADGAAPLSRVHDRLINEDLRLPPGALVVIDDAATATPAAIADLSQHAADIGCTLILLDSSDTRWPPGASARMLDLLESELPWTVSLTRDPDIPRTRHPRPPDLDPILTQATHLDEAVLTPELREFRRRHDLVHATNKQAYERHLTITRIRSRGRDNGLDRSYDAGIDLG